MFSVRKEKRKDYLEVERLVYKVMNNGEETCYDHYHLCRLRGTKDYNKELSFVAEELGKIIGYVTLCNATIKGEDKEVNTLVLFKVVVHEEYRNKGVGKTLIKAALDEAKFLGYKHVFVYGNKDFFAHFGFTFFENIFIDFLASL